MQKNGNLLLPQRPHKILPPHPLPPITTRTTPKPVRQPHALIVVPVLPAGAAAIVTVLVEEASARGQALGGPRAVSRGVDVYVAGVALQEGGVRDSPADDVDGDGREGEGVEAVEPGEPELVLLGERGGDLGALSFGDGGLGLPADAVVYGPFCWWLTMNLQRLSYMGGSITLPSP